MLNSNVEQEQIWTKLWDQDMKFYRRAMEDHIIREKVRMILYAAFVGSGGELNFGFWVRHRESMSFEAIRALVVDYDEGLLEALEARVQNHGIEPHLRLVDLDSLGLPPP